MTVIIPETVGYTLLPITKALNNVSMHNNTVGIHVFKLSLHYSTNNIKVINVDLKKK